MAKNLSPIELSWLEQILYNPHIGIVVTDIDRKILFVNAHLCEKIGYSKEELVGQSARIFHVSDKAYAEFFQKVTQLLEDGKPVSIDFQARHKNGETVWITISGDLLHDKKEILWTIIDITDRIEKEQEVKTLNKRMELAFSSHNAGFWEWNLSDDSVYISPQWQGMLGYEELLPSNISTWKDKIHPEDVERVFNQLEEVLKSREKNVENIHRLKHKSGKWIWVLARASIIYKKDSIRMVGIHTDITEQKELELKYAQQAQILEQVHDIVVATDMDGYILTWNKGAQRVLGYSKEEILNKHISVIRPKEDRKSIEKNIDAVKKNQEYHTDTRLMKKNGELIYANLSLSLFRDETNTPIGMIGLAQDITERKEAEDELLKQKQKFHHLAHHDVLTNLPNRLLFNDRLNHSIERAKRLESNIAVLFIDLDHFKEINDSFGHDTGDEVLKVVTKRFKERVRKEDTLARLGGDEFAIIMEDLRADEDASVLAQTIVEIFKEPILLDDYPFYLSCSIGISLFPGDDDSAKNLLKYADAAMYKAKENGRNGYSFYQEEMTSAALRKVVIETELRNALSEDQLVIYFQPQMNAKENRLVGMEALVRWNHPIAGVITPDKFLNVAESTGLIVEVDRYVIEKSIEQIVKWYDNGLTPGVLALNISTQQLSRKDFVGFVIDILAKYKCRAERIEFELTESGLMKNPAESIEILDQLSKLGIELAVDDFGTGYSSLSYLKKLPIKRLKIDKSFVDELPYDDEDAAITKAVIALAKSLNLRVIAEGVETEAQKEFLIENGCENIQGFLYSKAISSDEIEAMLLKIK